MPGARKVRRMVDYAPILVTGAAGQLGSVGRTVTLLLLDQGFPVRAMVRREDERAASLQAAGAQLVVCGTRETLRLIHIERFHLLRKCVRDALTSQSILES
jgi:nucleoside-diphosphate-sugar epimerase